MSTGTGSPEKSPSMIERTMQERIDSGQNNVRSFLVDPRKYVHGLREKGPKDWLSNAVDITIVNNQDLFSDPVQKAAAEVLLDYLPRLAAQWLQKD